MNSMDKHVNKISSLFNRNADSLINDEAMEEYCAQQTTIFQTLLKQENLQHWQEDRKLLEQDMPMLYQNQL